MLTQPRKSSWVPDRADWAICLKKRPRPLTPRTSFSLLTASSTEYSSSWSLVNTNKKQQNKIKTTIDKIFLETIEHNINLFVCCCIFLLSLVKLSINKKNGTRGGTSNLISQTRPTYQIAAHLNILATRDAEGALIQYQLVRRKREKTTTNNMRNINCRLSVSSFYWTLFVLRCCWGYWATFSRRSGCTRAANQCQRTHRLHSSLNYRAAHQYNNSVECTHVIITMRNGYH